MKDPYETLGVAPDAAAEDIRKAYRRLAKKLHPDLNPGDKKAEESFKEVSGAYDLLSDADKRRRFDAGEIDASGSQRPRQRFYKDFAAEAPEGHAYENHSGFADFAESDDIFAELFRRQARDGAPRARGGLALPPLDRISRCRQRRHQAADLAGRRHARRDDPVRNSSRARFCACAAREPHRPVRAKPATRWWRYQSIPIDSSPATATIFMSMCRSLWRKPCSGRASGCRRRPAPVNLTVPKGSNTGTTLRLKGKGVPRPGGHGDELVKLKVMLPPEQNAELEAFLSTWAPGASYDPRRDMQP